MQVAFTSLKSERPYGAGTSDASKRIEVASDWWTIRGRADRCVDLVMQTRSRSEGSWARLFGWVQLGSHLRRRVGNHAN